MLPLKTINKIYDSYDETLLSSKTLQRSFNTIDYKLTFDRDNNCYNDTDRLTMDEIKNFIKHTRPVDIIGYFYDDINNIYNVSGFVLNNDNNGYKRLQKGNVSINVLNENTYNIWMQEFDIEDVENVTNDLTDHFKTAMNLDILTTYSILLYRGCQVNFSQNTYAKDITLNKLNDRFYNYHHSNNEYYDLCMLYLYLSTNADLMNLPVEQYTINNQLIYNNNNKLVNGYNMYNNEIKDLNRINLSIYDKVLNYINFNF